MHEYSDYDSWAAWDERLTHHAEVERPRCACCEEPIESEFAYEFPSGDIVCDDCVDEYIYEHFRTYIG